MGHRCTQIRTDRTKLICFAFLSVCICAPSVANSSQVSYAKRAHILSAADWAVHRAWPWLAFAVLGVLLMETFMTLRMFAVAQRKTQPHMGQQMHTDKTG